MYIYQWMDSTNWRDPMEKCEIMSLVDGFLIDLDLIWEEYKRQLEIDRQNLDIDL